MVKLGYSKEKRVAIFNEDGLIERFATVEDILLKIHSEIRELNTLIRGIKENGKQKR